MNDMLPHEQPDYVGALGRAWRVDLPAFRELHKTPPDQDASVAFWYVHAPYAHPIWHSYIIGAVHLRDIPGQSRPPHISLPGATHETFVYALDPEQPVRVDQSAKMLHPANFAGQFIEASDEAAALRIERTVHDVCEGRLNPDTDYRQWWVRAFSDSNIKGDKGTFGQTTIEIGEDGVTVNGTGATVARQLEQGVVAGLITDIREDGIDLVIPPQAAPND